MILDRLLEPIRRVVAGLVAPLDYRGQFTATVKAQNGAILDLVPTDTKQWGEALQATVVWGMPGVKVAFEPGDKVLFGCADGDPSQPIVLGWYHTEDTLGTWTFDPSDDTSPSPIARVKDTVDSGLSILVAQTSTPPAPFAGTITFMYAPASGAPATLVLTFAAGVLSSADPAGPFPTVGNFIGAINSGASNVQA